LNNYINSTKVRNHNVGYMHPVILFIGILASVIAGYLFVELIHNIQLGEGMKTVQDKMMSEKSQKQAFTILFPVSIEIFKY